MTTFIPAIERKRRRTLTLIGIISNPRISALVRARERRQGAWYRGSRARDIKLVAAGVELSARVGIGSVQCDDLVANQVKALLQARGNRVGVRGRGFHQGGLHRVRVGLRVEGGRRRTSAQVLEVPSRPPCLILNQTALWKRGQYCVRRLGRVRRVRTRSRETSSGNRCRGSAPCT